MLPKQLHSGCRPKDRLSTVAVKKARTRLSAEAAPADAVREKTRNPNVRPSAIATRAATGPTKIRGTPKLATASSKLCQPAIFPIQAAPSTMARNSLVMWIRNVIFFNQRQFFRILRMILLVGRCFHSEERGLRIDHPEFLGHFRRERSTAVLYSLH